MVRTLTFAVVLLNNALTYGFGLMEGERAGQLFEKPAMYLDDVKAWMATRPTLATALGIEVTAATADYLEGRMPVDGRTHQPMGLLHGGASVALAETLGSIAASLRLPDRRKQAAVGLEINANHLKGVRDGWVRGRATPIHVGRSTQVWEIRITHEETGALVCISRITMAVIDLPAPTPAA
jgi:uncharacterized protein (TIGR00369 family)